MNDFKRRVKWPILILWAGRKVIMPIAFVFAIIGTAGLTVVGVEPVLSMQVSFLTGMVLGGIWILCEVGFSPPKRTRRDDQLGDHSGF